MDSELTLYHSDSNSMVVYHSEGGAIQLTMQLSDETVWLTLQQMMALFETSKQNVSLHINNIFREGELVKSAVVKDYLTTAADGKNYRVQYYNLDVIISVGCVSSWRLAERLGQETLCFLQDGNASRKNLVCLIFPYII